MQQKTEFSVYLSIYRLGLVLVFILFFRGGLFASSIQLANDSSFHLTAEVYDASGRRQARVELNPGQVYIWYDNMSPFRKPNDNGYTPFTITFICKDTTPYDYNTPPPQNAKQPRKQNQYQTEFGSWTGVAPGAYVNALGSTSGNKTCVIKKKQSSPPPPEENRIIRAPPRKQFQNWANDGGENWSNGAGPGWDNNDGTPLYPRDGEED